MLTMLTVENFRAFEEAKVELSKVNILVGPNNSGKSSLMSAISVLSQTLQSPDSDVPILLSGKFEDLGTYYDIVYSNDVSKKISFGIQGDFSVLDRLWTSGVGRRGPTLEMRERKLKKYRLDILFNYMRQRHEIVVAQTELKTNNGEVLLRTKRSTRLDTQKVDEISGVDKNSNRIIRAFNMVNFLPSFSRIPRILMKRSHEPGVERFDDIRCYLDALSSQLRNIEYVGPFRAYPERTYMYSGESPAHVGKYGDKAIDILVADEKRRGKKKKGISKNLSQWLMEAQIATKIEIESLSDRHFEILIQNIDTGEFQNLADAGFGCSQVLPIILAGLNSEPGSLLLMQQPEIHLHPKAQTALGSFIKTIASNKVQIIVETHSEHLILRLQSHVASGEMKAEDLNVFYFDADKNTGKKVIHRISVGDDGLFKEEWPKGFFPERLLEAKRLAKLSIRK